MQFPNDNPQNLQNQIDSDMIGLLEPTIKSQAPASQHLPASGNSAFQSPIKGTWYNSGGFSGKHKGVDLRAQSGTQLYPIAPGTVTNVGTDPLGGNVVNVQHANGFKSYYAHLATANVQIGQRVDGNTALGTVGNTGNASKTWPHCHLQVWKDNQIQDPAQFFSVPQYTDLTPQERQAGMYISEKAKRDAVAFNMKDHVSNISGSRFALRIDRLSKFANTFYNLSRTPKPHCIIILPLI
jgi:murein DD-endopeptidase MepM/ murein hydrolase activator NlpD